MDVYDFRKDFLGDVIAGGQASGEGSCASFAAEFARYFQEAEYLFDYNPSYFEGLGEQNQKIRVDGYAYDEFDRVMSLFIADFDLSEDGRVLQRKKADELQKKLVNFVHCSLNGRLHRKIDISRSCFDLIDLIRERHKEIRKYQLLILTTSSISSAIKIIESSDIDGVASECQIWDIARLFQLCGSPDGRELIEINFKEHTEEGIPCLKASRADTDDFESYLCIVPGALLADIYDKYGSRLLEGNVRSFLSTKVAVNKNIRTTILQQPERFFAYNNGISATAMDVQLEHSDSGMFIISAKDFQIINGGQTTASLSSARYNFKGRADLSPIFVQMKLTVINQTLKEEVATELIQNISRSSNSQNKVSDADFFSTHPFHILMEHCSQRLRARATGGLQYETKWFYERARGQYLQKQMRLTRAEKDKFLKQNPKDQLITKTDLAKVRNTWDGQPHIVSKGAQSNFVAFSKLINEAWEKDKGLQFGDKYFQETVALCLMFRFSEKMIPQQAWYQQGYRANIVTYTIALLRKKISKKFPEQDLDLIRIWNRQELPDAVKKALVELSEHVYDKLTDPHRGIENVTQWCKREACWENVQKIDYDLHAEIEQCLIGREEMRISDRDAKRDRSIECELDSLTWVNSITADQWLKIKEYAVDKKLVSSEELRALNIAVRLPYMQPTAGQCKKLHNLYERLYEEGYKV